MKFIVPFTAIFTAILCFNYAFGFYLFPTILPDMRADMELSYTAVGTMTAVAQICYVLASLVTIVIARRMGSGAVVIGSAALCGVALLLIGLYPSMPLLAVLLALMGAAAASVWIPMVAIVTRHVPESRRGTVLGIFSSAGAFGAILNGATIPFLLEHIGWRGVWISAGILTCSTVGAGCFFLARMGIFEGDRAPKPGPQRLGQSPWREIFQPHVALIWAVIFLASAICLPYQTYLSSFLREDLGHDVSVAANVWFAIGLIGSVGGGLMGHIADKAGTTRALILASVLVLASSVLLWLSTGPGAALGSGILYGLSYYAIFGLVPTYISKVVPAHATTAVFSIANVMVGVGGGLGNFLGGWSQTLTGGLSAVYVGCSVGGILLLLLVLALPREERLLAEFRRETP